jgi:predicted 3'-5' exonuclease similar to PolB exonuclease domain
MDEPPKLQVLGSVCHNDLCRAIGHDQSEFVNVRPVQRLFAHIIDTMMQWEKWGRNYITLDKLAKILGLESSKQGGIDGSRVYDCFCAGGHTEIAEYCMRDVELVREIFIRMISPEETAPTSS